jgi:hypothetical protein
MSIRASKTFSKHYSEVLAYDFSFADWLLKNNTLQLSADVTAPTGLDVQSTSSGGVVHMVIAGGTAGRSYEIVVLMTAANGLKRRGSIRVLVQGMATIISQPGTPSTPQPTGVLITGSAPAAGTAIARVGANWTYECVLEATAPNATATVRVRVGNTSAALLEFDTLQLTVGSSPQGDGKYRGVKLTFGNLAWPYHAADIVAISGAGAVVTINGSGS